MNIDPDWLKDDEDAKPAPPWLLFLAKLQIAAFVVAAMLWALNLI